jgi:hypothetical protein
MTFPAERWTHCKQGHIHWGAFGGAGLLLRYAPKGAGPTYLLQRPAAVPVGGRGRNLGRSRRRDQGGRIPRDDSAAGDRGRDRHAPDLPPDRHPRPGLRRRVDPSTSSPPTSIANSRPSADARPTRPDGSHASRCKTYRCTRVYASGWIGDCSCRSKSAASTSSDPQRLRAGPLRSSTAQR